jgi:uncharacterized protein
MISGLLTDPRTGEVFSDPLVIYHDNCSDGFAAAFAAWLHFKGQGEYRPMVHAEQVPDVHGRHVYMLDIAFDLEQMTRVEAQAARLTVLDHHQSAADALCKFRCRCGHVLFDMEKSAARLSWEFFHPDKPLPDLISHVEDRDLLRWALADSDIYLASLDLGPHNFHRWSGITRMPPDAYSRFLERGIILRQQAKKQAAGLAAEAMPVRVLGIEGLMVNAPNLMHNDVGELLTERSGTFALMWCLEGQGLRVKVGLRGAKGFDTIPLAKAFGGGGHPYSSAFRLPLGRLSELLKGSLDPACRQLPNKLLDNFSPPL